MGTFNFLCNSFRTSVLQNFHLKKCVLSKALPVLVCKIQFPPYRSLSSSPFEHDPFKSENSNEIGKIQPKLFLAFTCKICKTRAEKYISKTAYTKGVVIVRCDKCEENHLIADNLGWFPNLKKMRNIEDIMEAQGEKVKKTLEDFQNPKSSK